MPGKYNKKKEYKNPVVFKWADYEDRCAKGKTIAQVAKELNVNESTLRIFLKRNNPNLLAKFAINGSLAMNKIEPTEKNIKELENKGGAPLKETQEQKRLIKYPFAIICKACSSIKAHHDSALMIERLSICLTCGGSTSISYITDDSYTSIKGLRKNRILTEKELKGI